MLAYRSKTLVQASFWLAAVAVGFFGVFFDKVVVFVQHHYFELFKSYPYIVTLATPLLFLAAAALVFTFSPAASGSGIPQAMKAMMLSVGSHQTVIRSGLISLRAALVKLASVLIALLAGASIGREGPTVQISTAIFAWIGTSTKKKLPHVDFHSYLVAGAAAGVSAAFNTPLAGIAFALEELAEGSFAQIKQTVMISVIIAGIATQSLLGNYLYFGKPNIVEPGFDIVLPAIIIGLVGGLSGGIFAKSLAFPTKYLKRYHWWKRALICGILVAAINFFSSAQSAGTGYEITKHIMEADSYNASVIFPVSKLLTTALSYLSGMAGGIFSPSLAIGAGMGSVVGDITQLADFKTCALLGMVAFFTGAVQAPLTAVIIVMEMTDIHMLIIPLMISAFVSQGTSRLIMPTSLYKYLAHHKTF